MSLPGSRIRNISNSNLFLHNQQESGGDHSTFADYVPLRRFSTSGPASNPNKQSKTFKVLQWLTDSNNLQIRTGNDAIPSQLMSLRRNHALERRAAAQKSQDQINRSESASTNVYRTTSLQRLPQNFHTSCHNMMEEYNETVSKPSTNARPPINLQHQQTSYSFISTAERLTSSSPHVDARACDAPPPSPRRAQFTIRQPKFNDAMQTVPQKQQFYDKLRNQSQSSPVVFNKLTLAVPAAVTAAIQTQCCIPPRKLSISKTRVCLSNSQAPASNCETGKDANHVNSTERSLRHLNGQIASQNFRMLHGLLGEADEIMNITKRNTVARPLFVDTSYIPQISTGYTDF